MYLLPLLVVLAIPWAGVAAGNTQPIGPGSQVRLWRAWPFDYWEEGTVVALTGDTLVIDRAGYHTRLAIPWGCMERFQVQRSRGLLHRGWAPVDLGRGPTVVPGRRVRFRQGPAGGLGRPWLVGTVVRADQDSMVMDTRRLGSVRVPRHAISTLQVSTGRTRSRGVFVGAALGFVAGNLYHQVINPPEYRCVNEREGGECNTIFFLFREGIPSAVIGGLLGLLLPTGDRWEQVPLPPQQGDPVERGTR